MTIAVASDPTKTVTAWEEVIFTHNIQGQVGTKLTFDSANGIIIGSGVSKVKVSGCATFWTRPSGDVVYHIMKNTTEIASSYETVGNNQGVIHPMVLPPKVISVVNGDVIKNNLVVGTGGSFKIMGRNTATYLTVEVVE